MIALGLSIGYVNFVVETVENPEFDVECQKIYTTLENQGKHDEKVDAYLNCVEDN